MIRRLFLPAYTDESPCINYSGKFSSVPRTLFSSKRTTQYCSRLPPVIADILFTRRLRCGKYFCPGSLPVNPPKNCLFLAILYFLFFKTPWLQLPVLGDTYVYIFVFNSYNKVTEMNIHSIPRPRLRRAASEAARPALPAASPTSSARPRSPRTSGSS